MLLMLPIGIVRSEEMTSWLFSMLCTTIYTCRLVLLIVSVVFGVSRTDTYQDEDTRSRLARSAELGYQNLGSAREENFFGAYHDIRFHGHTRDMKYLLLILALLRIISPGPPLLPTPR